MSAAASWPPELRGDRVILRPATPDDVAAVAAILRSPEVARWWGRDRSDAEMRDEILDDEATTLAVVLDGHIAGAVWCHEEDDPDYRHASLDIALAPAVHGRGAGRESLRTVARHLFEHRGHHRITIDPAADNARAIACYRAVGFRPVGVMRRYERGGDGTWHDGLLMDLLREELVG